MSKKPRKPRLTWLTQMGDPFHYKVPKSFLLDAFKVMHKVPQHRFLVLTKRAKRLGKIGPNLPWRPWIWAGVTVESDKYIDRIDELRKLPADVNKFILFEPLIGPIPDIPLDGIDWVIVGGETNKKMKFRPMEEEWVIHIRDQALERNIPFLFKHWPGKNHNTSKALLEGREWREYPDTILSNIDWKED